MPPVTPPLPRAPPDAVDPEGHLLKRAATDAEVGLGAPGTALSSVDARHGLQQAIQRGLGGTGDSLRIEGHEVAGRRGLRLCEGGLDHGFGDGQGVLAECGGEWGKQKQGEGGPDRHAVQL